MSTLERDPIAIDAPPTAATTRALASLPGILLAGIGLGLQGFTGLGAAGVLLAVWLVVPIHYVVGAGAVLGFAVGGPTLTPATAVVLGGLALALAGTATRTDSVGRTLAVFGLVGATGGSLHWLALTVWGTLGAAVALPVAGGVAVYALHRYSIVRVARRGEPSERTDGTDARTDADDTDARIDEVDSNQTRTDEVDSSQTRTDEGDSSEAQDDGEEPLAADPESTNTLREDSDQ